MSLPASAAAAREGAENGRPFIELHPAVAAPVIDGRLNEPCWRKAAVITNFSQVVPIEGTAPSERTEVRFLFDRDHLYVGIRCYDGEPGRIAAKQMQHDALLRSDDYVKIAFDTFNQRREGYFFAINPAGARVEGQIQNFMEENRLWDTVWEARTRIDEQGWTAEMVVPFKSLSFDPRSDTWGCNIERAIRRKQETVRWTAISRSKQMTALSDFGELHGLTNLHQGRGFEFKPFTTVRYTDDPETVKRKWDFKPGFDVTYNLKPSLAAQLTVNTDFAEAEVDERMVNLSRFPLFYPEKRDFFLREAPLFSFGGLEWALLPFYSRRIGLGDDGLPVDIAGGGRVTGRLNGISIAALDVQQAAHNGIETKNLAVARVNTLVFEESNAGLVFTHGDPLSNGNATLGGLDFNYLNSRLASGRQLIGHAYAMVSGSDRMDGVDYAVGLDLDYPNEPLDVHLIFRQNGEKFDPALGFIERRGIREYVASVRYAWRPNTAWVRYVALGVHPTATTDLGNRMVAWDHDVPTLRVSTPMGDGLLIDYSFNRDVVDEPFETWPSVVVPARDYRWDGYRITLLTSEARPISGMLGYRGGTYYSGTRTDYSCGLEWRPSRHFAVGANYELREVRLAEGGFNVRIAGARLRVNFTPDLTWSTVAQFDNGSRTIGFNSRLRWTFRPGNDLFLVFNQGYEVIDWRLARLASEIAIKAGLTFRF